MRRREFIAGSAGRNRRHVSFGIAEKVEHELFDASKLKQHPPCSRLCMVSRYTGFPVWRTTPGSNPPLP